MRSNRNGRYSMKKFLSVSVVCLLAVFAVAQKKNPPAPHNAPAQHSAPAPKAAPAPKPQAQSNNARGGNNNNNNARGGANNNNARGGNANNANNNARGGNAAGGANNNNARGGNANNANNNARGGNAAGGANNNNARGGNANNANARGGNNNNNNARGGNAAGGANNNNARGGNANNANARGGNNNNNNARGGNANNNARGGNANNANARGGNNNNARGGNNGRNTVAARNAAKRPPATTREIKTRSGAKVQAVYRGGHVRTIQAHGVRIDRGFHGQRRIVAERNGRRIVSYGGRRGYVGRPYFNRGGRAYYQRTYYYGGRRYAYAYRGYYYHGARYYGYAPAYYYRPAYYGWAYRPWPAPAYYRWNYYNEPWYGNYNYYYQPYPSYPTAYSWVTDYNFSEYLRASYEARQQGARGPVPFGPQPDLSASLWSSDGLIALNLSAAYGDLAFLGKADAGGKATLTPEVKQALADEVKEQINAYQSEAGQSSQAGNSNAKASEDEAPPALDPKHHYFIVNADVDASDDDGKDCQLTAGDVIQRTSDQPDDDNNIDITVKSSKKDDCAVGTETQVSADDLQEMYNHFREVTDAGLKALADNAGKNGLPAAPDTTTTAGEVPAPTPDSDVDSQLQNQEKDADQTEADVPKDGSGQ